VHPLYFNQQATTMILLRDSDGHDDIARLSLFV
jgi:hypothetical protein